MGDLKKETSEQQAECYGYCHPCEKEMSDWTVDGECLSCGNFMDIKTRWVDAAPLPCPSWLSVKWEAMTDLVKGIFK